MDITYEDKDLDPSNNEDATPTDGEHVVKQNNCYPANKNDLEKSHTTKYASPSFPRLDYKLITMLTTKTRPQDNP